MFRKTNNKLDISDRHAIENGILYTLHTSGEIQQAIRHEVKDFIKSEMQSVEVPVINQATKRMVHEFMNSSPIEEIIDGYIKSYLAHLIDEDQIIADIIDERVDAAGIAQVIKWNHVAYGMLLARLEAVDKDLKDFKSLREPTNLTANIINPIYEYFAEHGKLPERRPYRAKKIHEY